MDITAKKRDLIRLVGRMQGVAERRGTMPILQHVLIEAKGDGLKMSATDLYLSLTGSMEARVDTAGSVAIRAKDLLDRIKNMPDGDITIAVKENGQTTLKAKGSARRYTLAGMPGTDFPPLPAPTEGAIAFSMPVLTVKELLDKVIFSASSDESRAHLNSVLFERDGELARAVTTDGHRLTMFDARSGKVPATKMLLPLKGAQEVRRICEDAAGSDADGTTTVTIAIVGDEKAFFTVDGLTLGVKLVSAQFPPYMQVVPKESKRSVRANRQALLDAVRAMSIAASGETNGVHLTASKGKLQITSESVGGGEGADEMPVEYAGSKIVIGLNAKYLLDVLGALTDQDVDLGLNEELDPMVVRAANSETFVGVVMPMRV